ncbi:MAG: PDZ domain-containing protein [Acidobacteria bacterium]|nr:PDZ domain-containing protein [Acidobacteriota bacterium]
MNEGRGKETAYLGATLREAGGTLTVSGVPIGTPAFEQGLNVNDQIVAVDGQRASQQFLRSYLNEKKPGDKIRLTVFRFDQLRDIGDHARGAWPRELLDRQGREPDRRSATALQRLSRG